MKNKINFLRDSFLALILLFAVTAMITSCAKTDTPAPAANEVIIQNDAFTPSTITVTINSTVKWTNKDQVGHSISSNTGLFDSGTISNSATYNHQFTQAGTFPYHCGVHPSMTGTVIVQ